MRPLHKILLVVLCLSAIVAGFSLSRLLIAPAPGTEAGGTAAAPESPDAVIGRSRPALTLPDLEGRPRSIAEWDGRVLLINFWATWCAPCRAEIPLFQRWRARYPRDQFEVIGIALDRPDAVTAFRRELDIDYPLLHGQQKATAALEAYGNRMGTLPYTVVVARDGTIADIHARGALDEAGLQAMLAPLLPGSAGAVEN